MEHPVLWRFGFFCICQIIVTRRKYFEWWRVSASLQWIHVLSGKSPRMAGVLSAFQGLSDAWRNFNKIWCSLKDRDSTTWCCQVALFSVARRRNETSYLRWYPPSCHGPLTRYATEIAGCACAGNAGNVFPTRRLQRKPLVSDPGMHHGTCVTHVPWCMSGSLTCGGGENVHGIPRACAPAILRIWQEAHGRLFSGARSGHVIKWEWMSEWMSEWVRK